MVAVTGAGSAAENGGSGPSVNGAAAAAAQAAQMSFQPTVTYTLAPGMTPVPG